MSKLGMRLKAGVAGLLILATVGCTAVYRNHGYVPTKTELEAVTVGVSSRDSVAQDIGAPTLKGMVQDGDWYYVQSRWRSFGMKPPKEIDRQVLAIRFDKRGVVSNIERYTLADGRVVVLSRRVTNSNIKGVSFIRQLLGNIGRIGAGDVLGNQ